MGSIVLTKHKIKACIYNCIHIILDIGVLVIRLTTFVCTTRQKHETNKNSKCSLVRNSEKADHSVAQLVECSPRVGAVEPY